MSHDIPNTSPTPAEALNPTPQHDLDTTQPEREITREAFVNLFDDLMLQHIEDVASYRTRGGSICSYAILEHRTGDPHVEFIDSGETGEHEVTDDYRNDWRPRKEIQLQVGGKYGDALTYRLYADGTVRRYDTTFDNDHENQNNQLKDALVDNAEALDDHMENTTANLGLARDLGMNDQPVASDEIDRLRDYIASLDLTRTTAYANRIQSPYPDTLAS